MQYLIVSGEAKPDALSQSFIQEIIRGASDAGADVQCLSLEGIERCRNCNDGWGDCKNEHTCAFGKDGFQDIQSAIRQADAICIVTPVHLGKPADWTMNFMDRLRKCESGDFGAMANKPALVVSFPGNTESGMLSCLEQMDKFCRQTGSVIFDYLSVNSWNSDYTKTSAYHAGRAMAYGRKAGEMGYRKRQR